MNEDNEETKIFNLRYRANYPWNKAKCLNEDLTRYAACLKSTGKYSQNSATWFCSVTIFIIQIKTAAKSDDVKILATFLLRKHFKPFYTILSYAHLCYFYFFKLLLFHLN